MTNEELEHGSFEIENRIRNLMWTISGDYDLDTKPDVTSFYKSKYISIYDAIKQGAFSRFFDKDAFALYLLKKVYLGADESQLVTLGQICVEAACHDKIAKERPGVPDIRKKAFEAIMDHDFEKMLDTYTGKVKLAYMREALTGSAPADSRVIRPFEQLKRLEQAQKTEELVQRLIGFTIRWWIRRLKRESEIWKKSFPSAQKNYPALTGRIFWKKKRRKMLIGGCSISWQMP